MRSFRVVLIRALACCTAFGLSATLFSTRVAAQEVEWRYDYGKALQEAAEKARPLVIDFGTENCFWCRQLDQRTFRDPGIVALMNQRCIPLRIDAQRTPALAEALKIQNYPTLVFASPESRVLGSHEGFLEAAPLKDKLLQALAMADPEWMVRDFQEAIKARDAGDAPRAIKLLKGIVADGKDRLVQTRSSQLLRELEMQTVPQVTPAAPAVPSPVVKTVPTPPENQNSPGVMVVTEMVRAISGTLVSRPGTQMLASLAGRVESGGELRQRVAHDLLAQAREDYNNRQFMACLDRCESVAASYADLPEAREANQLAEEIKKNPEWTRQACDQLADRLSLMYLSLADSWVRQGQPQQAIFYLERVMQNYPNSKHAEAASVRLAQLQGQPLPRIPDQKK
jgi:hypothetical protein